MVKGPALPLLPTPGFLLIYSWLFKVAAEVYHGSKALPMPSPMSLSTSAVKGLLTLQERGREEAKSREVAVTCPESHS